MPPDLSCLSCRYLPEHTDKNKFQTFLEKRGNARHPRHHRQGADPRHITVRVHGSPLHLLGSGAPVPSPAPTSTGQAGVADAAPPPRRVRTYTQQPGGTTITSTVPALATRRRARSKDNLGFEMYLRKAPRECHHPQLRTHVRTYVTYVRTYVTSVRTYVTYARTYF